MAHAYAPWLVASPAVDQVVRLEAGVDSVCALRRDGTVWCWGRNVTRALGRGTCNHQPLP